MENERSLMDGIIRYDINNLLMVINAYLYLIRNEEDEERRNDYLGKIAEMSPRIEKILDFWKKHEEGGEVAHASQKIREIAKGYTPFKIRLDPATADIEVLVSDFSIKIVGDLVENSIVHGYSTQAFISHYIDGKGNLVLVYEDDGKGIPPSQKDVIFSKGFSDNEGTGYGLYFIRRVLELNGGGIIEVGDYGKGVRFELTVLVGRYKI